MPKDVFNARAKELGPNYIRSGNKGLTNWKFHRNFFYIKLR